MGKNGDFNFFFTHPTVDIEKINFKGCAPSETKKHLEAEQKILEALQDSDWNADGIKAAIMTYADTLEKRGLALHPLRYSLSGLEKSPDPFTIAAVIGKEDTLTRITTAIAKL